MMFYVEDVNTVLEETQSRREGLTEEEAAERLERFGKNKLKEAKKDPLLKRFFQQMMDPMIIILLVAALISGITGAYSGEGMADVVIILIVVVVNAVLGVYQESKAEKAIEALQEMAAATSRVYRNGHIVTVRSEDLVVGDVILLEAGDAVPADARLLESVNLQIEEAALTGESVPVYKFIDILNLGSGSDIPLGDRKNMVYMGTIVTYGRGSAVVTATGMDTEMGKIAEALAQAEEGLTPLQIKLAQLSKVLTYLVLGICVLIFGIGILRAGEINASVMLDTFMIAVSLAVAAIPEGLVAVVTIVLSIGVTNMSQKNAIIRRLTAVETLGCAQIICSDKTGTLTQNKMTVVRHYGDDLGLLAKSMALCSDAELGPECDGAVGEPTECALVNFALASGQNKNELKACDLRIGEAPFDSGRKMMSTVHRTESGIVQYTKGAPDEVLKYCTTYWKDGRAQPLDEAAMNEILDMNRTMAGEALRVLSSAMRWHDEAPADYSAEALERDLCFIGLVGMIDPVRPEVRDSIVKCRSAGITPIMITGDHIETAMAIARQLGILHEGVRAVSGAELDDMSDEEYLRLCEEITVYARVQPEHKTKIVNAWRSKGYITAMTGDGVNDAPSIKSADIGVGMGITGTDVTKNVADMVLADDNFATIVSAIEEGRRVYDNIRKAIQYLLGSNMSEVLSILFATLFGFVILKPVHLLWINLVTDCIPALALGLESAEKNIMQRAPRNPRDGIFAGGMGVDIAYQGLMVTVLTLTAYFIGHFMEAGVWEIADSPDGMTMAFLTMSMAEICHSLNMRSQRQSIFKMKSTNNYLIAAAFASLALTTLVIYVPFLADAFGFQHINLTEYFVALALAALTIPIVEIVKFFQRRVSKHA